MSHSQNASALNRERRCSDLANAASDIAVVVDSAVLVHLTSGRGDFYLLHTPYRPRPSRTRRCPTARSLISDYSAMDCVYALAVVAAVVAVADELWRALVQQVPGTPDTLLMRRKGKGRVKGYMGFADERRRAAVAVLVAAADALGALSIPPASLPRRR